MTDLLGIRYHAVDHLPADAVALIESDGARVDVFLSAAHPLDVVAAHLTAASRDYVQRNAVGHRQLSA